MNATEHLTLYTATMVAWTCVGLLLSDSKKWYAVAVVPLLLATVNAAYVVYWTVRIFGGAS